VVPIPSYVLCGNKGTGWVGYKSKLLLAWQQRNRVYIPVWKGLKGLALHRLLSLIQFDAVPLSCMSNGDGLRLFLDGQRLSC
jgi:hypothetical protein